VVTQGNANLIDHEISTAVTVSDFDACPQVPENVNSFDHRTSGLGISRHFDVFQMVLANVNPVYFVQPLEVTDAVSFFVDRPANVKTDCCAVQMDTETHFDVSTTTALASAEPVTRTVTAVLPTWNVSDCNRKTIILLLVPTNCCRWIQNENMQATKGLNM